MINVQDFLLALTGYLFAYWNAIMFGTLITGFLYCFFGYRLFKLFVFLFGMACGVTVLTLLTQMWNLSLALNLIIIVGGGILIGVILLLLRHVGVFALGLAVGGILASLVFDNRVVIIVIGVITGVLAVWIKRPVIILLTAFSGAIGIVYSSLLLVSHFIRFNGVELLPGYSLLSSQLTSADMRALDLSPQNMMLLLAAATLIVGIIGAIVQFKTTRKKRATVPAHG